MTHLGDSRKKPRLTSRARGMSCDRRRLLFAEPICRSLNVSSRITAKLRDLRKLHDSLPKSRNVAVTVAVAPAPAVAAPDVVVAVVVVATAAVVPAGAEAAATGVAAGEGAADS